MSQSLLEQLRNKEQATREEASGLSQFSELRIKTASDFQAIGPELYKAYKDELPLLADLPKAPTLGSLGFLLPKNATGIKEIFEDNWNSSLLSYAANADLFLQLAQRIEDGKEDANSDLVKAATRALLCAANQPARNLEQYKYQAQRRVDKHAQKPGSTRDTVITEDEAKALHTTLETASKIERLSRRGSGIKGISAIFNNRGRGNRYGSGGGRYRPQWFSRGSFRGRRGRGGRTGGRGGRGSYTNQQ